MRLYLPYKYYSCNHTAASSNTSLIFAFRNDISEWDLDDVSVIGLSGNVIINGGFETTLAPWKYSNPFNAGGLSGIGNMNSHTGTNYYSAAAYGAVDYLIQSFSTVTGLLYNISFYLYEQSATGSSSSDVCSVNVTVI
ncbi:unnamed protein product [Didymodactylos carnosus]|uniref:Uncharacterized protein n=1 Tax=Didymodactylos carnosus TaxID=1234261 RepID=A0A814YCB8_9BILA|nr:unnamed protein product [Didymodactylos carnosus]CAF3990341.1 unnamed protein product [Didymodactylos carnosus]